MSAKAKTIIGYLREKIDELTRNLEPGDAQEVMRQTKEYCASREAGLETAKKLERNPPDKDEPSDLDCAIAAS